MKQHIQLNNLIYGNGNGEIDQQDQQDSDSVV